MTFRKLLNCPTGDARRQAPQVEANGCTLNYLEWDRRFCKRWVHCVGGGVRLGLMLCDKPHEAFIGGSASSIFQLYSLAPDELNAGASTQQPSVRANFLSFVFIPFPQVPPAEAENGAQLQSRKKKPTTRFPFLNDLRQQSRSSFQKFKN